MKRSIIYIIVAALALLMKPHGTDVGKLIPVEVIWLSGSQGQVMIETDTGNKGTGKTIDDAIENLKKTTAGVVYLDTADFLLVSTGSVEFLGEMGKHLKSTVEVCGADGEIDLTAAAEYLAAHRPNMTLKKAMRGGQLPELKTEKERLILN